MLLIYTILYFVSVIFYYLQHRIIASVIMISLAIFLYGLDVANNKRIVTVRGLFVLGFIGGFGLSLLKLSKLSQDYNILTFIAVFISYFALYFGTFLSDKKMDKKDTDAYRYKIEKIEATFLPQEILLIVLFIITCSSFITEVVILKFIPIFTLATPHAYSTFHVFMLHYITSFHSFIPCFAICNYFIEPTRKKSKIFLILSFIYVIIMSLLMVSRSQLTLCIVLSLFIVLMYRLTLLKKILSNKRNIIILFFAGLFILALYLIITINRSHSVEYLKGIFEMKNENIPIFITQPYMYITHNFENLNYMIENIFRFTFGRRVLYPFFTLTLVKKFFPIVTDAPYYIIKEELSTVTLIYDFYYDFGLVGVAVFCFIIGYVGKKLENQAYSIIKAEEPYKNNYIIILYSLYCYFMIFSFFQTYFSLTDTWVYIIILLIIALIFDMKKETKKKPLQKNDNQILNVESSGGNYEKND
ncbi:MAG: oligosaccharide repeat unit polymerase [Lachnospiraceae bacterium]|nr:oligosaccharide repeat unit polymerase [Lachnospiraceae bacterium]